MLDEVVYCAGGAVYNGTGQNLGVATSEVHAFDAATREWSQAAAMTEPRAYHACAVWRNKIYAVGGENQLKQCDASAFLWLAP